MSYKTEMYEFMHRDRTAPERMRALLEQLHNEGVPSADIQVTEWKVECRQTYYQSLVVWYEYITRLFVTHAIDDAAGVEVATGERPDEAAPDAEATASPEERS